MKPEKPIPVLDHTGRKIGVCTELTIDADGVVRGIVRLHPSLPNAVVPVAPASLPRQEAD
ncbi:hypothetical protein [Nocardioides sp.]|uniref:hypothetical protein n=1 Tax=Nocardioides sp. TaxID=35761 RepID=UPI0039E57692